MDSLFIASKTATELHNLLTIRLRTSPTKNQALHTQQALDALFTVRHSIEQAMYDRDTKNPLR